MRSGLSRMRFRCAAIVVAVGFAVIVTACGSAASVTYEGHSHLATMVLNLPNRTCIDCGRLSAYPTLTGSTTSLAFEAELARRGLEKLVVFCAWSATGTSDRGVAVTTLPFSGGVGGRWSFSTFFSAPLPRTHGYICGFRAHRPTGASPTAYTRGALLAVTIARQ